MDGDRFDALARATNALCSRRGVVGGALAALLAASPFSLSQEADARRARRRRRRNRGRGARNQSVRPLGALCSSNDDCDTEAACVPGLVGLRHCKPADDPGSCLGVSEACRRNRDCCGDLECLASDGFVSCQVRPTEPGGRCREDAACGAGASCRGRFCRNGGQCVDRECVCDAGLDECDERCVDTRSDASHCGDCDTACNFGEVCRDGACRCGDGGGCASGEICFDGLCALGGGGSGELPLYGWGGVPCSFSRRDLDCLVGGSERRREFYGAVRRYRDAEFCKIDAQNKGSCRWCPDIFGLSCRPQVTPTATQIREFCQNVQELPDAPLELFVDCISPDCRAGEHLQFMRFGNTDWWVCAPD